MFFWYYFYLKLKFYFKSLRSRHTTKMELGEQQLYVKKYM